MHTNSFTILLNNLSSGDDSVLNEIVSAVYSELKQISSHFLNNEHKAVQLQTTELVHEAYIKLCSGERINWQSRAHFFGIAARTMRQILVDHARYRKADKRGGGQTHITLGDSSVIVNDLDQLIGIDDALKKFEEVEERASKIVELRYFSGLSIEETAEIMQISPATVKRDLTYAKAWLYRELS